MTDEQYQRLFAIATGAKPYRMTRSNASWVQKKTDEALAAREFIRLEYDEGAGLYYTYVTSFGLLHLHHRLATVRP